GGFPPPYSSDQPDRIVEYVYDPLGRLVQRSDTVIPCEVSLLPPSVTVVGSPVTTTTRFVYDGDSIWRDTTEGASTRWYVRGDGPDELFARVDRGGLWEHPQWYLTDRQGTVLQIATRVTEGIGRSDLVVVNPDSGWATLKWVGYHADRWGSPGGLD